MQIIKQGSTLCPQQDLKNVQMAKQGSTSDAEMLAEAAMLREHRNRLENRMVNDHFVFIIVNIIIIIVIIILTGGLCSYFDQIWSW